jgi:hypothetical protein
MKKCCHGTASWNVSRAILCLKQLRSAAKVWKGLITHQRRLGILAALPLTSMQSSWGACVQFGNPCITGKTSEHPSNCRHTQLCAIHPAMCPSNFQTHTPNYTKGQHSTAGTMHGLLRHLLKLIHEAVLCNQVSHGGCAVVLGGHHAYVESTADSVGYEHHSLCCVLLFGDQHHSQT